MDVIKVKSPQQMSQHYAEKTVVYHNGSVGSFEPRLESVGDRQTFAGRRAPETAASSARLELQLCTRGGHDCHYAHTRFRFERACTDEDLAIRNCVSSSQYNCNSQTVTKSCMVMPG